jgi:hypothetical protein
MGVVNEDLKRKHIHNMKSSFVKWVEMAEQRMKPHLIRLENGEITGKTFSQLLAAEVSSYGLPDKVSIELGKYYIGKISYDGYDNLMGRVEYLNNIETTLDRFLSVRNSSSLNMEVKSENRNGKKGMQD